MSEKLKFLIKEKCIDAQYFHEQGTRYDTNRYTAVVEVCDKESFSRMIEGSLFHDDWVMDIYVGYTRVSPKDQYCKKTGREYSVRDARKVKFKLDGITLLDDTKRLITLIPVDSESDILAVNFEIKTSRERVYFTGLYLNN